MSIFNSLYRFLNEINEEMEFDKHQKKIALDTLKMNKVMASVIGGMSHKEAIAFLRKKGYSDKKIKKLLLDAGHSQKDIDEMMRSSNENE